MKQSDYNLERDIFLSIPAGRVPYSASVNKFGHAADFDTGDGLITVWDGANDAATLNLMQYTYSTTAAIDTISSSDNTDTQTIEIQGLDGDYNPVTQTVTLTGQTQATMGTPLLRVFRMKNTGTTDISGTVYCYENVTSTAGVPDTLSNTRSVILGSNNQTLMAIYTVPAGKTAYMTKWDVFSAGASRSADYEISLVARPPGQVFQIKHHASMLDGSDSHINVDYKPYNRFGQKTDIEMRVQILTGGVTAAGFSASFDLILLDN